MTLMDSIKGAIILRELLVNEPDPEPPAAFVPSSAPPIFHWLGVAPEPLLGDS
jgi:hypothetical protein